MWSLAALLVLGVAFPFASAAVQYGAPLQRIKRTPHYSDCPPFYPPHAHRHFWPPPPYEHAAYSPPPPFAHPPSFGPPPFDSQKWQQAPNNQPQDGASPAKSQALTAPKDAEKETPGEQPCEKCEGRGHSSAVSNAKSDTGSAIAIAISGRDNRK